MLDCTDAENVAPFRIRSPDRPAGSESLYRLPIFQNVNSIRTYIQISVCVCVCLGLVNSLSP